MSTIHSLIVDFSKKPDTGATCSGLKLEVPKNEVAIGDSVEIRLWGPLELLGGWWLMRAMENLGPGALVSDVIGDTPSADESAGALVFEQVSFAATSEAQLEWPAFSLVRAVAVTELLALDADGKPSVVKPRGWVELGSGYLARKGYSCVRVVDDTPLYGAIALEYYRVRWYRRWFWTVPKDSKGDVWFFLYDGIDPAPYRKFAIELPELAATPARSKNITIRAADHATEAAIPNATIFIGGAQVGVTDSQGLLHVNGVASGEHAFRATAAGYLATNEDELSNEKIVV